MSPRLSRHCLAALTTTLLVASFAHAVPLQDDDDNSKTPTLTVTGTAEITAPADQLRISIGVTTEHTNAEDAVEQNADAMTKVLTALGRAGIAEDEIETGRFNVRPQFARRPRQPEEGWQPTITGYQVVNTVTITTGKLDEAGSIIDAAARAGSNTIDEIAFELADEQDHRAEVIAEATRNAISDARAMANAAGVRLARIQRLNLGSAGPQPTAMMARRGIAAMEAGASTPITPGDVTLHASVTVVFEIEGDE